jgi:hypothetical protein
VLTKFSVDEVHEPVVDVLVVGDVPIGPVAANRPAEHLGQGTSAAGELLMALSGATWSREDALIDLVVEAAVSPCLQRR